MHTRVAPEPSEETEQPVGSTEKVTSHVKVISERISKAWNSLSPLHKRTLLIVLFFLLALIIIIPTAVVVSTRSKEKQEAETVNITISNNSRSVQELPGNLRQVGNQVLINLCESNPCKNNATCISQNDGYACECQDGYYGNTCDKRNNSCDSNPCKNNGTCVSKNNNYTCQCKDGYSGNNCGEKNNLCDSNPCENNATCVNGNNDYTCQCQEWYYGKNCDEKINFCESNPCENNGNCMDGMYGYTCQCEAGYSGNNCGEEKNFCNSNPCENNATCVGGNMDYECYCKQGYSGRNCNETIVLMEEGTIPPSSCIYELDGVHMLSSGLTVLCHNGWIVFQQNTQNMHTFMKTWNEYKSFFGNLDGNFWLGLDNIHNLTKQGGCRLRVDLWDPNDVHTYAEYREFYINNETDNYRLHVSGYNNNSTAGDGLTRAVYGNWIINNMPFSTKDRDNDNYDDGSCSQAGGWWFNRCRSSILNKQYGYLTWNLKSSSESHVEEARIQSSQMMLRCD